MPRRRDHHLDDRVFESVRRVALLTMCTAHRKRYFELPGVVEVAARTIERFHERGWRNLAYCVMPDHVHVLLVTPLQPPRAFVQAFKAVVTRAIREVGVHETVWQRGYHDRVIRRSDGIAAAASYVIENPVRKGLVRSWTEWHASGSLVWPTIGNLLSAARTSENILWRQALDPKV